MTVLNAGASSACTNWATIDWEQVEKHVKRLQVRIAKAIRDGKRGKAKALQWLLTHSHHAKLLAVRRVTQTKGAKLLALTVLFGIPTRKRVMRSKRSNAEDINLSPREEFIYPREIIRKGL